jgi:hypothetical protein
MSKPTHPLPLEARRVLWTRIWDRLLAPPRIDSPPSPGPTRDGRPADTFAPGQDREGER